VLHISTLNDIIQKSKENIAKEKATKVKKIIYLSKETERQKRDINVSN